MKTVLRNKFIAVLSVLCAFMGLVALFCGYTSAKADVTPVTINNATISISNTASIKTAEPMGIKFTASISKADYEGLRVQYGSSNVEYGMVIVPSDFVGDEKDFKVGGWTAPSGEQVVEYAGEIVANTLYYQRKTVTPTLSGDNYVFSGSLVGIYAENYARDFVVKAYVSATEDGADPVYNHSDMVGRSVYTVATGALASGALADDDAVVAYMKQVTGTVNGQYTGYAVDYYNATSGKQESDPVVVGDKIAFKATLTKDGADPVYAIPSISNIPSCLQADVDDYGFRTGTYTVLADQDFGVKTTIDGTSSSKDLSCWVDVKNASGTVAEITLENSAEGQEWAGFFKANGNGSINKITEQISGDEVSKSALDTAPNGEDVYVINTPAYSADKIELGVGMKEKLLNKYISFKYYNYGYSYQNFSWSLNGAVTYNGSIQGLSGNGYNGRYIRNIYDQFGNNVGNLSSNWTVYNNYRGTWCTVEIAMPQWFNAKDKGIDVHTDQQNTTTVYENLFVCDFKVSDYSIAESYSDLEVVLVDANGGKVMPGDTVSFDAYATPIGKTQKEKVNANIVVADGALENGVYQGKGNFTVTANAFGQTAELVVNAEQGELPKKVAMGLDWWSAVGTTTVKEIDASAAPSGISGDNKVFEITFASNGYGTGNAFRMSGYSNLYAGCYVSFKYYLNGHRLGFCNSVWTSGEAEFGATGTFNSDTYRGSGYIKQVAYDGTPIISVSKYKVNEEYVYVTPNISNYNGTWVTIEMYFKKTPNSWVDIFMNQYYMSNTTLYITDLLLTNYSTLA